VSNVLTDRSRRAGRLRLFVALAVLAVVPTVALIALSRWATDRVEAAEPVPAQQVTPGPATATPLLSARRVPQSVHDGVARQALVAALAPFAQGVGPEGCFTTAVDGVEIVDAAGARAVLPASNTKLVTAAVALEVLGADHRFTTTAKVTGRDGGTAETLYLVGGGDPVLGTQEYLAASAAQDTYPQPLVTPLESLADQIVASGITHVTGGIVGDGSRYDGEEVVPTWPESYIAERQSAPLSALLVNDGSAQLSPLQSTAEPVTHAAGVLHDLLEARGVTVEGGVSAGVAPADVPDIAAVQSATLAELMPDLLAWSDNTTAELLVKEIAVATGTVPGTRPAGLAAIDATLRSWGVPLEGVVLTDGSGLDRGNRLTCDALGAVLARSGPDGPLAAGLSVAGQSGTLAGYFVGNEAQGRLAGKTGTLTGARALSGFVAAADGTRHVAFNYVENGDGARPYAESRWGELGRILTTYPQAPAVDQLAPLPATTG
jgi:D-alanyl-D-alanine carboxypeptidase/D-alanyl-D-alanine-endopeptidase (penicillin-binding protein 4)